MSQCNSQIFGGEVVATIPLSLKPRSFLSEDLREPLHGTGNEIVRLLDGVSWLVNEAHLQGIPASEEILRFLL